MKKLSKKKTIIVSGGSGSIGRSIINSFSDYYVFNIDIKKPKRFFKNEKFIHFDLSDYKNLEKTLNENIEIDKSNIYGLVNNAAITIPENILNYDLDNWEKTLNINLSSAFVLLKYTAKLMIKKNIKGSIVNITSIGAEKSFPNNPAYQSSKAALKHLTKSAAYDLSKYKIRVNSLAPGYTESEMNIKSWNDKKSRNLRSKHTFLNRWAKQSEISDVVKFLIEDKSSYINGSNIVVDGGWVAKGFIE